MRKLLGLFAGAAMLVAACGGTTSTTAPSAPAASAPAASEPGGIGIGTGIGGSAVGQRRS